MALENLTINRICLHEVHRIGNDGNVITPTYGTDLLNLQGDALDAFRSRVISAFKNNARCMEMCIRDFTPGSAVYRGSAFNGLTNAQFVSDSKQFANALATAQSSRTIPGGLAVVFDGTVGNPATPFFAIMKAELHEGFLKTSDLKAQFVSDLFLSPKTKLYKIGMFISDGISPRPTLPGGWMPLVYDSAMSTSNRDAAATYFYSVFLGLDVPDNAAHQVRNFFDKTKTFISTSSLDSEQKIDLFNSLYSYLKVDQGNTIQVSEFADRFMPDSMADQYKHHMQQQNFPATAIRKDLTEVKGSLRLRRFKFARSITLSGPPEAMSDLVTVSPVVSDGGTRWTQITIRGQIEAQE